MEKVRELAAEFREVLGSDGRLLDAILPPLLFVILNSLLNFQAAMIGALLLASLLALLRLRRGQQLWYVLGGVAGVLLAFGLVQLLGREELFFLPGMLTGGLTVLVAVVSIIARRPMVAWTSALARRWPWDWYWHPRVRPAYTEVTWMWAVYFGARLALQLLFFQNGDADVLAVVNLFTGWPGTVALLVISYLYGTWRLRRLAGPSIDEFRSQVPPPWQSQQRGF